MCTKVRRAGRRQGNQLLSRNLLLIVSSVICGYFFDSHHCGTRKYRQTYHFLHDEHWSSRSCDYSSQEFFRRHYVPSWCSRRTTTARPQGYFDFPHGHEAIKFKLHVDKVYYGKQCRPLNIYCNLQNTFPVAKFVMPSSLNMG